MHCTHKVWPYLAAMLAVSVGPGCSSATDEDESDASELRTDPAKVVSTNDSSATVLASYNALSDRVTNTPCVASTGTRAANVGDVRSEFYLKHITSKDELATELGVDVTASFKVPQLAGAYHGVTSLAR